MENLQKHITEYIDRASTGLALETLFEEAYATLPHAVAADYSSPTIVKWTSNKDTVWNAFTKAIALQDIDIGERSRILLQQIVVPGYPPDGIYTNLDTMEIVPRVWTLHPFIPHACITILTGLPGMGKTRLAIQLMSAIAAGKPNWLHQSGYSLAAAHLPAPVILATWEDDVMEVARRIPENLRPEVEDRFVWMGYKGASLWGPDKNSDIQSPGTFTQAGQYLLNYAEQIGAKMLVLDSLAGVYGSCENTKSLVRSFMGSLDSWATRAQCTVLIIAHPAKSRELGVAGNMDWHAAARSILGLDVQEIPITPEMEEDGIHKHKKLEAPCLRLLKANYAKKEPPLWLQFGHNGWDASPSALDAHRAYEHSNNI